MADKAAEGLTQAVARQKAAQDAAVETSQRLAEQRAREQAAGQEVIHGQGVER